MGAKRHEQSRKKIKLQLTLLAALAGVIPTTLAASNPLATILRHDCDYQLEILALKVVQDRAKCVCPELTQKQLDSLYDPVTMLVESQKSATDGGFSSLSSCLAMLGTTGLDIRKVFDINLPESCVSSFTTTGKCNAKIDFSEVKLGAGVSMWKCPNSLLPGFSVHCLGSACSEYFRFCESDADCGSLKCFNFLQDVTPQGLRDAIFNGLKEVGLASGVTPGCFQDPSLSATPSGDLLTGLITLVQEKIWSITGKSATGRYFGSSLKMCGIDEIQKFSGSQFKASFSDIGTTCLFGANVTSQLGVTVDSLQSWDGLVDGKQPQKTITFPAKPSLTNPDGGYKLVDVSCDGTVSLMNGRLRVKAAASMVPLLQSIVAKFKSTQDCQISSPLSTPQFLVGYGLWTAFPWMYNLMEKPGAEIKLPPPLQGLLFSPPMTGEMKITNFPVTCSFTEMLNKNANCGMAWTGLSALTKLDVKVAATIGQCPQSNGDMGFLPSISLSCVGDDCGKFLGLPKSCATNADCGSGARCVDIWEPVNTLLYTEPPSAPSEYTCPINSTDTAPLNSTEPGSFENTEACTPREPVHSVAYYLNKTDPIAYGLFTNLCEVEVGQGDLGQCHGIDKFVGEVDSILRSAFGFDSLANSNPMKYCFVDLETTANQAEAWSKSLASGMESNKVSLNYMEPYPKIVEEETKSLAARTFGTNFAAILASVVAVVLLI